jgi:hypothetical protein
MSQDYFNMLKAQADQLQESINEAKQLLAFSKDIGTPNVQAETQLRKYESQLTLIQAALKKYINPK